MINIRPQSEFPLLGRYKSIFKITDDTIFAYDHVIYSNNDLPRHLVIHELVHHEQQDHHGLDEWVDNYLNDEQFRLKMEVDAYTYQLKSIDDRNHRAKVWMESAKNLSSDLYGNIISYKEAIKLLKV